MTILFVYYKTDTFVDCKIRFIVEIIIKVSLHTFAGRERDKDKRKRRWHRVTHYDSFITNADRDNDANTR